MRNIEDPSVLFQKALESHGLKIKSVTSNGLYVVPYAGIDFEVSLENTTRDYLRDGNIRVFETLVNTLLAAGQGIPSWNEAKNRIYFSAQPSDIDFGDTIVDPVTDDFVCVVVIHDPKGGQISWVTQSMLKDWNVSREEVRATALNNMATVMEQTPVKVDDVLGHRLGMLETHSPFKASLIFSPNFKEKISHSLGWPVYVVIPCRSFAFVIPEVDKDLLSRVGKVVVEEFQKSGHPITCEVLHVSDKGISAIGTFLKKE